MTWTAMGAWAEDHPRVIGLVCRIGYPRAQAHADPLPVDFLRSISDDPKGSMEHALLLVRTLTGAATA